MSRKRAILYLAWGEEHIERAAENIRVSFDMSVPAVLITDPQSLAFAERAAVFNSIVTSDFAMDGHLRKTELWQWLPDEYDSFLFLDTDVRVLHDVSLGFDKAEEHGIALTPAPHYSMDYFFGFRDVMTEAGVEAKGQLLYNSGVIFFTRTARVEEVFSKWKDLAAKYHAHFKFDQAFLTLAMELLNFNPFTLSPSYNFREKGELISGIVRVWHSRLEIPPDLNTNAEAHPRRRVLAGKVVQHSEVPLRALIAKEIRRFRREFGRRKKG